MNATDVIRLCCRAIACIQQELLQHRAAALTLHEAAGERHAA